MKLELPPQLMTALKPLEAQALAVWRPLQKRLFFIFILLMLATLSFVVYTTASVFAADDEAYRQQKEAEIVNIGLNQDKAVVDKVLQLETVEGGPIRPEYVPGRDNPFKE